MLACLTLVSYKLVSHKEKSVYMMVLITIDLLPPRVLAGKRKFILALLYGGHYQKQGIMRYNSEFSANQMTGFALPMR